MKCTQANLFVQYKIRQHRGNEVCMISQTKTQGVFENMNQRTNPLDCR